MKEGHIAGNDALAHEALQLGIHGNHGFIAAAEDNVIDLMGTAITNHILNGRIDRHELEDGDAATIPGRNKALGHNSLEHHGELDANLRLLLGREGIHNAVNRFGGSDGVQGRAPRRTTSGACRRAARRAREKVAASLGTSRWETRDFLCR